MYDIIKINPAFFWHGFCIFLMGIKDKLNGY